MLRILPEWLQTVYQIKEFIFQLRTRLTGSCVKVLSEVTQCQESSGMEVPSGKRHGVLATRGDNVMSWEGARAFD